MGQKQKPVAQIRKAALPGSKIMLPALEKESSTLVESEDFHNLDTSSGRSGMVLDSKVK